MLVNLAKQKYIFRGSDHLQVDGDEMRYCERTLGKDQFFMDDSSRLVG